MSIMTFQTRIISRFGGAVQFTHEDGKHIAYFPESGVRITSNSKTCRVAVTWGAGHYAFAQL